MKTKTLLLTAALGLSGTTASANLILTGIVDGPLPGGSPKAIELFATADIADLSGYGVELVSNDGNTAGVIETAFSGSILAGEFYYVATEAVEFANVFGFAPNITTNDANHNGDDDFYIYGPGNALIDVWGGSDGVDNSLTVADVLDSWAYRLDGTGPSTSFNEADWTVAPINSLDGLTAAEVDTAVPFGTYAIPEPSVTAFLLIGMGFLLRFMRKKK
jgi:hypothetical protein